MKLEHNLQIHFDEDILRERISAYLTQSGYQHNNHQTEFAFQRGSILGSLSSFSPRGWKSNISIRFSSSNEHTTQVFILFDINTTGQWVTEKEREFWQMELHSLVQAITTGAIDISHATENAKSALIQNLISVVIIVGLPLLMFRTGLLLFGTRTASFLMGLLGLGVGVLLAHLWLKFKIGE